MMTFNTAYSEAFVWIWLPGKTEPVVAGKLPADDDRLLFNYGRSYLARDNAIALYDPELPLQAGVIPLFAGLSMPGRIRDASPDAWGRRVIIIGAERCARVSDPIAQQRCPADRAFRSLPIRELFSH